MACWFDGFPPARRHAKESFSSIVPQTPKRVSEPTTAEDSCRHYILPLFALLPAPTPKLSPVREAMQPRRYERVLLSALDLRTFLHIPGPKKFKLSKIELIYKAKKFKVPPFTI